MARKVLRIKIKAICNTCDHSFDINERMHEQENMEKDMVPFSAKSSSTTMICPECRGVIFRLHYEYQNVYRIRCKKCSEMFDSPETYNSRCPKCQDKYLRAFSMLGA